MSSQRGKNHGLRESYEMRNINQQPNRSNVRHQTNDQKPNKFRNQRIDDDNSQPSPSRQSSSKHQNYADYNNRPIFNLQNPNYMNPASYNDEEQINEFESDRTQFAYQDSSPVIQRYGYSHQDSGGRNENPDYIYKPKNQYYHTPHMQNEDEYSEVFSRWCADNDSELVNRQHRTTSIHRNTALKEATESTSRTFPRSLENRRKWMSPPGHTMKRTSLEQRATNITSRMEEDDALMEDTPESELLRRDALRDMPQCLTVKRIIKKKLNTSVNKHSKHKPLGCCTSIKYNLGIKVSKMHNSIKSWTYSFELWYSSLKIIEGHFGSGVATYFKFFRWLFIINCFIAFFTFMFLVIPQLLSPLMEENDTRNTFPLFLYDSSVGEGNFTTAIVPETLVWGNFKQARRLSENNAKFEVKNIFTGEGYFTNTTLYYGFYSNNSISLAYGYKYNIPYAYFFTMLCMYVISFFILSTSMAKSYRRSFIETQGGLKNVYAHKIFCGWDYSIATEEAGDLKSSSIYHELKELVSESVKNSKVETCMQRFWTYVIQLISNLTILCTLVGTGYAMWKLLEAHNNNENNSSSNMGVVTAAAINVIMLVLPTLFSFIVHYEDYKHPRAALYITLIRTFLTKTVIIGVFLGFWLTHSKNEKCWETSIGQHIYRLILFDFMFSVVLAALVEAVRYFIYKKLTKKIGVPEFDIARYTLQLMYNQTLFWVGFYYSPLLPVVVVLKLWCTWYIRRMCLLHFCRPSTKSWKAAQTHTWFLILSFLSLLLVLITHGYIIVDVATSNCGPFRDFSYMYEMILKGIFQLEHNNIFWKILMYLTKPGTVALILIAMCVVVYYLRAKAIAQKGMVDILRNMLILEAKDKEFLLENISKVTEGQWQYNLQDRNEKVSKNPFQNAYESSGAIRKSKPKEDFGDGDESSSTSENLQDFPFYNSSHNKPFLHDDISQSRRNFLDKRKY